MGAEIEGKARITSFATEDEANAAARRLLEVGIAPLVEADTDPVTQARRHWLLTLSTDAPRAFEELGVSPPERIEEVPVDGPITREQARWRIPRDKIGRYAALYLVLVVIVCALAFAGTVWLLGGFDSRGELPEDNFLNTTTTT